NEKTFRRGRRGPPGPREPRSPPQPPPPPPYDGRPPPYDGRGPRGASGAGAAGGRGAPPSTAVSGCGCGFSEVILHSLLERDLVGIEAARLLAVGGTLTAHGRGHAGFAARPRVEHLEVVRADVEAGALLALAIRVRARREAALDQDEAPLGDHLLRALREAGPAAHAIPICLLHALLGTTAHAVHGDAELAHRLAVRRHLELGVAADVSDDDDLAE